MNLLGTTGPQRTNWLNSRGDALYNALRYYLGPTGIPDRLVAAGNALAYTDAGDMVEATDASRAVWNDPSLETAARYATAAGALAIPFVGARMVNDGVDVVGDAVRSGVDDMRGFTRGEDGAIRAWHGSPHDFDRFSLDKIGTGEGAQAYGHGLYFAEKPEVAKSYRANNSASANMKYNGRPIKDEIRQSVAWNLDYYGYDKEAVRAEWARQYRPDFWETSLGRKIQRELDRMDPEKISAGRLYEVNIDANPEDFLDWDSFSEGQPERVKQYFEDVFGSLPDNSGGTALTFRDMELNRARGTYGPLSGTSPLVSEEMKQRGIPGIRYLDAGSRGAGDGSRNYVVFDDKLISILNKYGLAGLLGLGAGATAMSEPDA